jgi:hypothetical protein
MSISRRQFVSVAGAGIASMVAPNPGFDPDVTQFWTYDNTEFLRNPVYARDYPPAKNLEQ